MSTLTTDVASSSSPSLANGKRMWTGVSVEDKEPGQPYSSQAVGREGKGGAREELSLDDVLTPRPAARPRFSTASKEETRNSIPTCGRSCIR